MNRLIALSFGMALVLTGCGSLSMKERQKIFEDGNANFAGKTFDELVKGKGVPTGTATLSDGSRVVEFYTSQVEISGGGSYPFPASTYVRNSNGGGTWVYVEHMQTMPIRSWNKICKVDFVVSPNGIVETWKYEGKGCY